MITEILEAETEHEVIALKNKYFDKFHPSGYGTTATKPLIHNGVWIIKVSRFNSCD